MDINLGSWGNFGQQVDTGIIGQQQNYNEWDQMDNNYNNIEHWNNFENWLGIGYVNEQSQVQNNGHGSYNNFYQENNNNDRIWHQDNLANNVLGAWGNYVRK